MEIVFKPKVPKTVYKDYELTTNFKDMLTIDKFPTHIAKTNKFIKDATIVHNGYYDYSKVRLLTLRDKVDIICPTHGSFLQRASNHKSGVKCPTCSSMTSFKDFTEKCNIVHDNLYEYIEESYKGVASNVSIICKEHGIFKQHGLYHLKGGGCAKCKNLYGDTKVFINKAQKKHGGRYDYSQVDYINSYTDVKIVCSVHGAFLQRPKNHIFGTGCIFCTKVGFSKSQWIEHCKSNNVEKCSLYLVNIFNNAENFYKIGITSRSVKDRFNSEYLLTKNYDYSIITELELAPDEVWKEEKKLHKKYQKNKYTPHVTFGGHRECFKFTNINTVLNESFYTR